jgi:hypothetical protein
MKLDRFCKMRGSIAIPPLQIPYFDGEDSDMDGSAAALPLFRAWSVLDIVLPPMFVC